MEEINLQTQKEVGEYTKTNIKETNMRMRTE